MAGKKCSSVISIAEAAVCSEESECSFRRLQAVFGFCKGVRYLNVMFGCLMSNLCFSQSVGFSHSDDGDPLNFNVVTICTSLHRFPIIL